MENQPSTGSTGPSSENSSTSSAPKILPAIDKAHSRAWKGIVWHHSASPDGNVRDWPGIVKYHTSYRVDFNIVTKEEYDRRFNATPKLGKSFLPPWRAVGYHGGIELVDGEAVYCQGRSFFDIGAHSGVAGASNRFNEEYLGLCALGNYDIFPPPEKIWTFAKRLTRELMDTYGIIAAHVIGHREVYDLLGVPRQKSCPGNKWSMDSFREELKSKEG